MLDLDAVRPGHDAAGPAVGRDRDPQPEVLVIEQIAERQLGFAEPGISLHICWVGERNHLTLLGTSRSESGGIGVEFPTSAIRRCCAI